MKHKKLLMMSLLALAVLAIVGVSAGIRIASIFGVDRSGALGDMVLKECGSYSQFVSRCKEVADRLEAGEVGMAGDRRCDRIGFLAFQYVRVEPVDGVDFLNIQMTGGFLHRGFLVDVYGHGDPHAFGGKKIPRKIADGVYWYEF